MPIPVEEQIRLFNSMPQAQQNQLIRELQRQLPPAQREAIVSILQGRQGNGQQPQELDDETSAALDQALRAQTQQQGREPEKPVFKPRDTLVLEVKLRAEQPPPATPRTPEEQRRLEDLQERIAKGNPYDLDRAGQLILPGVPPIALAGLNIDEATVRIQNEPVLRPFDIVITRLPLEPVGTEALEPFGYDLFK
ncbi:MAG TPA: hypothetical protein VFO94_04970, partial [Gammaproteobacteria bacterium]|nr:hypothetical protein [Gammaproteobacteria bacterium]